MTNDILNQCKIEYKNLQDQINDLQNQMQAKAKVLMHEAFKDFFSKYNEVVENIFWTQYAPYFNDGEECVFSVHGVYITLNSDQDACRYEGSQLYDQEDIKNLKQNIAKWEAWEKDPMGEASKYRTEYIKKYNRNPFDPKNSYERYIGSRAKTEEDLMREWKPYYVSKEELQERLVTAELIVSKYPNLKSDFGEIESMVSGLDDDLMKAMFGNHVKVIVSSDAIDVEEYDHD